jgi:hypothetical protein
VSTSGSVDYSLVTNTIVEKAFIRLGVASEGEAISARMYEDGRGELNIMVKAWGARGHLWLRTEASVTLVASQAEYALATLFSKRPLRVLSVRRRITSGSTDTPLTQLSREEYYELPNKTTAAVPTSFYYDPQRATGTLYIWPTASTATAAAQTLRVDYARPIEDFDATNNDPDLPQEWLDALIWNLADNLETAYPVNNPRLAAKISGKAAESLARIESWDTEPASLYLQPDWRGQC